jgi:hypothetical protein
MYKGTCISSENKKYKNRNTCTKSTHLTFSGVNSKKRKETHTRLKRGVAWWVWLVIKKQNIKYTFKKTNILMDFVSFRGCSWTFIGMLWAKEGCGGQ